MNRALRQFSMLLHRRKPVSMVVHNKWDSGSEFGIPTCGIGFQPVFSCACVTGWKPMNLYSRRKEGIVRFSNSVVLICFMAVPASAFGQELRTTLKDLDVGTRWQYNDWEAARAAANRSKKPILALFR